MSVQNFHDHKPKKHIVRSTPWSRQRRKILYTLLKYFPDVHEVYSKKIMISDPDRGSIFTIGNSSHKKGTLSFHSGKAPGKRLELLEIHCSRYIPTSSVRQLELALIRLLGDRIDWPLHFLFMRHSLEGAIKFLPQNNSREIQELWHSSQKAGTCLFQRKNKSLSNKPPSHPLAYKNYKKQPA